ncbi:hypothetical protein Cflav_PD4040 [Pedosphaera parvula Ellin514]|uniref:Uncharacterized protein n=2 Tax=Pedosphaera TaxID=1032526 RepID=B9XGV0_PEDPL|nr:hypothetical protein Cflav_PD4040 [Pedosphaera parvula Ellin514]
MDGKPGRLFEERVVIFLASSHEEALAKGQAEAKQYAESWQERQPKLLAHMVAFSMMEPELREGEEVWSCLRELEISDEGFLDLVYAGEMLGLRHLEKGEISE